MRVRIKEVPKRWYRSYLKIGKEYEATLAEVREDISFFITCDDGDDAHCYLKGCEHLDGGSWEIVEEVTP